MGRPRLYQTDAERKAAANARRKMKVNSLSEEERRAHKESNANLQRARRSRLTEVENATLRKANKASKNERRDRMTEDAKERQRRENALSHSRRLDQMSEEERDELRRADSLSHSRRLDLMSEEERDELRGANALSHSRRLDQMTEEERDELRRANALSHSRRLDQMSNADRVLLTRANTTSRAIKRSRTMEEVRINERAQKREAAKNERSKTTCIGLGAHDEIQEDKVAEHFCGAFDQICLHCKSFNFLEERRKDKEYNCCNKGKVHLQLYRYPLRFKELLQGMDPLSENFLTHIRKYNSALAFASMGAQISLPSGRGPYCFRIHGQVYHNTGSLHPKEGEQRKFAQIYILDPDEAAEQRMAIHANAGCAHEIMLYLSEFMKENNPYAQAYKMMYEVEQDEAKKAATEGRRPLEIKMALISDRANDPRRYNAPRYNEVAIVFQSGDGAPPYNRDFMVTSRSNTLERVGILHPGLDPMTYPLLIPYGEAGWSASISQSNNDRRISQLMYYSYFLAERAEFNPLFYAGKLSQQYIVDAYCKIEANRLNYIEQHQKDLRCENYTTLHDYVANRAQNLGLKVGRQIILPSSFGGSERNMTMHYQDAMAIIRKFGKPDLFVTMTCNPKWKEITGNLKRGQSCEFRPDLVSRVFNLKLKELIDDVTKKNVLGICIAHVYVIEFQKRGLPHAHILIVLGAEDKPKSGDLVDRLVSAEIPNPESHQRLHSTVLKHMIHGPCGSANLGSPCMSDGKCQKDFPKAYNPETNPNVDGYPLYRRRNNEQSYEVGTHQVNNTWVVPYNPYLLLKYNCHINVEICASIKSVKYLFKYVYKGHDCANIEIRHTDGTGALDHNEVKQYLDSRYVSAPEAIWRIFAFDMHKQSHSVDKLPIHLPDEQVLCFQEGAENFALEEKDDRLTSWFKLNQEDESARQYLYTEIPEHYTYISNTKASTKKQFWKPRQGCFNKIGRMYTVSVTQGELFYMRLLLLHVRGATSFEYLRSIDGDVFPTFKEAAAARNLLADDKEWDNTLMETASTKMPFQIRQLFAFICVYCEPKNAFILWETHKDSMTEDFVHRYKLDKIQAEYQALIDIQDTMVLHGKKCSDYGLSAPPSSVQRIVFDSSVDYEAARVLASKRIEMLNCYQRGAFEEIMAAVVDDNEPIRLFFLDGPGGSGKTFTYETLYYHVTGLQLKLKCCASTGIAGTLLPFGSTYHSTFKLPVPLLENSTSSMRPNSVAGQLLRDTKLILWDEVTMTPHYALKAVDLLLRDLMNNIRPFGGKVILLGGDFRQILPVVKRGNRVKIVQSCLKMGKLWPLFKTLNLATNMRLSAGQTDHQDWLLNLGNGTLTNDANLGEGVIEVPPHFIEHNDLIDSIFGKSIKVKDIMKYANRAILCPKNEDVHKLNKLILARLEGQPKTYLSVDSIITEDEQDIANYPLELLHSLNPSGLPPHELQLKVGAIIMLLRNLNTKRGLCNGTRLIVKSMHTNFIAAEVITGKAAGDIVFIPRIDLSPSDSDLPCQLKRRQFPVMLAFAMTINKSQGQSLDWVGIFLPEPVFSHGQLYVAFSRGKNKAQIKVKVLNTRTQGKLIKGSDRVFTRNCVYNEILQMDQLQNLGQISKPVGLDEQHQMDVDEFLEEMPTDWELAFPDNDCSVFVDTSPATYSDVLMHQQSTSKGEMCRYEPPISHNYYDSDLD